MLLISTADKATSNQCCRQRDFTLEIYENSYTYDSHTSHRADSLLPLPMTCLEWAKCPRST